MNVDGACALITGGASGLGLATARRLAAAGMTVAIVDLPQSVGAEVAAELGGIFIPTDVTSATQVRDAVSMTVARGPIRVVVNCAGIAPPAKVLGRDGSPNSLEDFERVIGINLIGTYNVISQTASAMIENEPGEDSDRGLIVNTASVAAFEGQIGQPAYAASKGGVHAMMLPIARELARFGIRVMTIAPGTMETPMLLGLPLAAQESLGQQVPYPSRLGRADEYAALVMHLVENGYLNAETIRLDGAIRMAGR
ncbi:NAD(P)-dependent dehydrogenase (short-subunit alcohol dehydrogenase family) [Microbacterium sp. W4I4]|uniref:SDR family NAD(P)-dependent oxidoreductase n=1 Tax=Microbacterium sp. W4I4 TaxID=3042295 RepID=UPI00278BAB72|nr:SDR family NAD(P)-dependent oxidoreductase [Microbacterium sp. W4I4]MDQ0615365.1 NAD(P)-dependent dehydrogenase (short-subunit alcohol dehydrogenase family) [Microbacterium sp. W4I4]